MFCYNFEHYRALAICRYNLDVINKSLLCYEPVRKKHVDIKLAAMFVNAVDRTSCPRGNIGGSGATVPLAPPPRLRVPRMCLFCKLGVLQEAIFLATYNFKRHC